MLCHFLECCAHDHDNHSSALHTQSSPTMHIGTTTQVHLLESLQIDCCALCAAFNQFVLYLLWKLKQVEFQLKGHRTRFFAVRFYSITETICKKQ